MNCKAISSNGKHCKASVLKGGDYCYWHSPETKESRAEAGRKGGLNRKKLYDLETIGIEGILDIPKFLIQVINEVRTGKNDIKLGNVQGYLTGHLIKAYVEGEQAKQIQDILARLDEIEKTKL